MASVAAPCFVSTTETTNYARLCRLLADVSTHVLRETFEKKRPKGSLDTPGIIKSPCSCRTTITQKKKNCLIHHNGENYTLPSNLQFHLSISTLPY